MKKLLIITTLSLLGIMPAFAQKQLIVHNILSCAAPQKMYIRAHDNTVTSCANMGLASMVSPSSATYGDLTAFDYTACATGGNNTGWKDGSGTPVCADLSGGIASWDWDVVIVVIDNCVFHVTYNGSCLWGTFSDTDTQTTTSCGSVTVTFTVNGSGDYVINIS